MKFFVSACNFKVMTPITPETDSDLESTQEAYENTLKQVSKSTVSITNNFPLSASPSSPRNLVLQHRPPNEAQFNSHSAGANRKVKNTAPRLVRRQFVPLRTEGRGGDTRPHPAVAAAMGE